MAYVLNRPLASTELHFYELRGAGLLPALSLRKFLGGDLQLAKKVTQTMAQIRPLG